jgi:hypothetical protein
MEVRSDSGCIPKPLEAFDVEQEPPPIFNLDPHQQTGKYIRESQRPPKLDNKDSAESDLPRFL